MATVTQRKRDSHRKQQLPVWQPHQWISPRLREVAYDQIGEASQEKLAQAVVFLANAATGLTGMCLASLELLRQLRRFAMARIVTNTLLFLFLVSGCGFLSKEEVQAPKAPERTPAPVSSTPVETASDRTSSATTAANTTVSKEELRMLQARLKAAGFYVGPIDGIVGPKTKSGLFRLQAACANLKDLLETSAAGAQPAKLDNTKNSSPKSEEIRLIQVRLKDTGFDPGPIDGVLGAKTRAAFLRFEAGCTMLNNLPPAFDKELQTADRRISVLSEKKSYPVAAKLVGIESDKITTSGNQTLSSEKIRQEQSRLIEAGFDPGPIDGILGPKTKAAMQRYQKSLALKNSK